MASALETKSPNSSNSTRRTVNTLFRAAGPFIDPAFEVQQLPPYETSIASNPFKVYRALPPDSRYRFLLDDARFFIEGFIKGPVCRRQVTLNMIEDQFWVMFFDPVHAIFTQQPEFLDKIADDLQLPADRGNTLRLPQSGGLPGRCLRACPYL